MILETIPQLALLTREDKSCLAYELWDAAEGDEFPLTPQQQALLEERLAAYDANPDAVLTMEQATERMEQFKEQLARERSGIHE